MLTRAQFASVVRADEKWVENASRALGKRLSYTIPDARWLGLVRLFTADLRVLLHTAAMMADRAITASVDDRVAKIFEGSGGASVVVDLARYHSDFAAAVATALHNGQPKAPGRPVSSRPRTVALVLQAARDRGVDLSLLRAGLERTPGERLRRLDENTAFIRAIRPVSRPNRPTRPLIPLLEAVPLSTEATVSKSAGTKSRSAMSPARRRT